jgi:hypothetical protein
MSSSLRKGPSGHAKRKRAKELAALIQSQRGDIHKFFRANTGASVNPNNELAIAAVEEEQPSLVTSHQEMLQGNFKVLCINYYICYCFRMHLNVIEDMFFTYIITVVVSILRPEILVSPRALKILGPPLKYICFLLEMC